jgi:hypothetical protein
MDLVLVVHMDKDLKVEWVTALRSGQYTQCTGYLMKDGAFCVLGVLGDILTKRGILPLTAYSGVQKELDLWELLERTARVPVRIGHLLSCRNDGAGWEDGTIYASWSFTQLADYIELNL